MPQVALAVRSRPLDEGSRPPGHPALPAIHLTLQRIFLRISGAYRLRWMLRSGVSCDPAFRRSNRRGHFAKAVGEVRCGISPPRREDSRVANAPTTSRFCDASCDSPCEADLGEFMCDMLSNCSPGCSCGTSWSSRRNQDEDQFMHIPTKKKRKRRATTNPSEVPKKTAESVD